MCIAYVRHTDTHTCSWTKLREDSMWHSLMLTVSNLPIPHALTEHLPRARSSAGHWVPSGSKAHEAPILQSSPRGRRGEGGGEDTWQGHTWLNQPLCLSTAAGTTIPACSPRAPLLHSQFCCIRLKSYYEYLQDLTESVYKNFCWKLFLWGWKCFNMLKGEFGCKV